MYVVAATRGGQQRNQKEVVGSRGAAMYQQAADFRARRPCLGTSFVRQRASPAWRRHVFFSCSLQRLISGPLYTGFATVKPETIDMHAHMYVCVLRVGGGGVRPCRGSVARCSCASAAQPAALLPTYLRSDTSSFAALLLLLPDLSLLEKRYGSRCYLHHV